MRVLCQLLVLQLAASALSAQTPARWTLSAKPLVEIGAVDGDTNYELFDARSSVRLVDGRIVVLNAGSHELRFYDAQGRFLFKTGGKGNGPGEFLWPARLYYTHQDSLIVYDQTNQRESHLDTKGRFAAAVDGARIKGDTFRRDAWLYGRTFVDGPPIAAERDRIRPALKLLPALTSPTAYRYVKVDPWLRLWVREARVPGEDFQRWTIYSEIGKLLATLTTPANFEIHQVGPDFLLGVQRDAMDVEFVRLFALSTPGTRVSRTYFTPASARDFSAPRATSELAPELVAAMRSYVRNVATAQEVYYSRNSTYARDPQLLPLPEDRNITPHMISASSRGWTMLVIHRDADAICTMAQGAAPVGWTPGIAVCGEAVVK